MLGGEQQDALLTESICSTAYLRCIGHRGAVVLLQFGQALASRRPARRGNSTLSSKTARVWQGGALADGLNVPIGRLRKLAEEAA